MIISKTDDNIVTFKFVETAENNHELTKNFRIHESCITIGEEEKKISIAVSAQFSENNLRAVLKHFKDRDIEIINMRHEPYCLIEGTAIVVADEHLDDVNHMTSEEMIARLQKAAKTLDVHTVEKVKEIIEGVELKSYVTTKKTPLDVYKAVTEEHLAKELGVKYSRVPVKNHHLDEALNKPELIDDIVAQLNEAFAESDVIYLHCEGGKSRSTAVAIMGIIMLEAKKKSFDEIKTFFESHARESDKLEKYEAFFQCFHEFCTECDPASECYSEWYLQEEPVVAGTSIGKQG